MDKQMAVATGTDGFRVGYSKVNITPSRPTILLGYAQPPGGRYHKEVLDPIYLTCLAVSDAKDNTVLLYTVDLVGLVDHVSSEMRTSVVKATGISGEHIFFGATHTHSAPDDTELLDQLKVDAVRAAEEALADRKEARMYFGKANTSGISFIRHYYAVNGKTVSDNHGDEEAELMSHTTQIDEEMRILQFKREGGKDVILANWQCHPHMTGDARKYDLSADIVGAMRANMERELDCLFAYYQGGAGNINPISLIPGEEVNTERDYRVSGRIMADTAKRAMQDMTQVQTGDVRVLTETYTCKSNKVDLDKLDIAQKVVDYHRAGHTDEEAKTYAESLGLASYYHASNILMRQSTPDTYDLNISTVVMGDVAWTVTPGEYFDSTMKYIRDNSPYDCNFNVTWFYGPYSYYPSLEAFGYGCYETDTARAEPGTAEGIADRLLEMLNTLHGK